MNLVAAGYARAPDPAAERRLAVPPGTPPLWPADYLVLVRPEADGCRPAALGFVRECGEDAEGGWVRWDLLLALPADIPLLAAPDPGEEVRKLPPEVFAAWCESAEIRLPW